MVVSPPGPFHRQNRRRERPGARKRHALALKEGLAHELAEGMSLAYDYTIPVFTGARGSVLQQNYDRNWRAWKTREAEQRAVDKQRRDNESYLRLFGGDVDDDVSLCKNMLGVVFSLWGDIDYTDP